ncbi:conserved hypothetical protein [Stigmatella aurantiaca DW4/3-1]|uniref:Uncharacterized protein n=1 Tax=Stigmatella aurantiaca (strain DW4/3-1) TaxID=378806 RepID=Q09EC3_STIAD|nr:conserved hypothetical protein [Stigmatella aurantiaca DW4/3-1]
MSPRCSPESRPSRAGLPGGSWQPGARDGAEQRHRAHRAHPLAQLPVLHQQRAGEGQTVQGDGLEGLLGTGHHHRPVPRRQEVVGRAGLLAAHLSQQLQVEGMCLRGFPEGRSQGVPERQPAPGHRLVHGRTAPARGQRHGDELKVLVWLARARQPPPVVEAKRVELRHAVEQRLEVRGGEQGVLVLVVPGDEQGVVLVDIELVQQARVRGGDRPHEEVLLIGGQKGILRGGPFGSGLRGPRLALQVGDHPDEKRDALVLDDLHLRADGHQRPTGERPRGTLDEGIPQRSLREGGRALHERFHLSHVPSVVPRGQREPGRMRGKHFVFQPLAQEDDQRVQGRRHLQGARSRVQPELPPVCGPPVWIGVVDGRQPPVGLAREGIPVADIPRPPAWIVGELNIEAAQPQVRARREGLAQGREGLPEAAQGRARRGGEPLDEISPHRRVLGAVRPSADARGPQRPRGGARLGFRVDGPRLLLTQGGSAYEEALGAQRLDVFIPEVHRFQPAGCPRRRVLSARIDWGPWRTSRGCSPLSSQGSSVLSAPSSSCAPSPGPCPIPPPSCCKCAR